MRQLLLLLLLPAFCAGQNVRIQKTKKHIVVFDSTETIGVIKIKPDRKSYKHFEVAVNGGYQYNTKPNGYGMIKQGGAGAVYGVCVGLFTKPTFSLGLDYSWQSWNFGNFNPPANVVSFYLSKHILLSKSEIAVALKAGYVAIGKHPENIGTGFSRTHDVSGVGGGLTLSYRYNVSNSLFISASAGANMAYVEGNINTSSTYGPYTPYGTSYPISYTAYYFPATIGIGFKF